MLSNSGQHIFDVTNTTTHKFVLAESGGGGNFSYNRNWILEQDLSVIRLGDT